MRLRALGAAVLIAGMAGCGGGGARLPAGGPGGVASTAAVERFLQLARDKDYVQMGWVFGTEEGPVIARDPIGDVERRMYALADVLQHEAVTVGSPTPVPGRIGAAESFQVQIRRGGNQYRVPMVVVRGPDRRWFVEQVDVEAVTNQ